MADFTDSRPTLHLPNLSDRTRTLCGLPVSEVVLGGYCEHLDDNQENPGFVRSIFDPTGQPGEPCPLCLFRRTPTLTTDNSLPCHGLPLFVMICPAPQNSRDEFDITAVTLSKQYKVLEPVATGEYAHGPAMALVLRLHIIPEAVRPSGTAPPGLRSMPACYGNVRRSASQPTNTTTAKPHDNNT